MQYDRFNSGMDVSIPSERHYPRNKDRHFKVTPAKLRTLVHQIEAINKSELWIKVVFQCQPSPSSIIMLWMPHKLSGSIHNTHKQTLCSYLLTAWLGKVLSGKGQIVNILALQANSNTMVHQVVPFCLASHYFLNSRFPRMPVLCPLSL